MAGAGPKSRFDSFAARGVLNEWLQPQSVGGEGLTACNNVIYHREGAWGKRPGTTKFKLPQHGVANNVVSGVRWYRTFPTIVTKLVVWSQGNLMIGDNPSSLSAIPGPITLTNPNIAPDFCSMRDPQAAQGSGADVLIVAGLTHATQSFATGGITIQGLPPADIGTDAFIAVTMSLGAQTVTTANYQILPTDTPASIAEALVELINQTTAYLNNNGGSPFMGVTYFITPNPVQTPGQPPKPQAIIHMGARGGGANGNSIQIGVSWGGTNVTGGNPPLVVVLNGSVNVPAGGGLVSANLSGGGNPWSGPLRYDLGTGVLEGLSYMAPNPFEGCATWHDHLWLWADPNNADTVFASDIYQPEAFTFMAENGGMSGSINGGYTVGPGDGDPGVKACVPNGNSFCLFKTENIYQVTGYDFQQGEYQFSVTPLVVGYGVPSRDCVDVLEGQYVFWSGRKCLRLAVGAYEPEHIGLPIPLQEGLASQGLQSIVKVVAGDFQVQTQMIDSYVANQGNGPPEPVILRSLALFAVDDGNGNPATVLVYDDEKTAMAGGSYAWSVFTGWNIGCWIKYGLGRMPAASAGQDNPFLFFVDTPGADIWLVGGSPNADGVTSTNPGNPIPWAVQTGWIDLGTPELLKNIHEFYIRLNATNGVLVTATVVPARIILATPEQAAYPNAPVSFAFSPAQAPPHREALNDLKQFIQPAVQTQSFIMQFAEDGTSMAGFELLSYGVDCNPQEAYQP